MDTDDIAFDALATGRALRAAGVEDRQAEAIAAGMRRVAIAGREGLATKADLDVLGARVDAGLAAMRSDLGSSFASMRAHIDTSIAALRADLYRALWIQGAGVVAAMTGFVSIAALLGMFR